MSSLTSGSDDALLTPREVAAILGVRPTTVARWARDGRLKAVAITPGGHRRYRRSEVAAVRDAADLDRLALERTEQADDLIRLYAQGWPVRRVADAFGFSYSKTRRILLKHTTLRSR